MPAVPIRGEPPVDNPQGQSQLSCVKPKPDKVEEPTAPYVAKPVQTPKPVVSPADGPRAARFAKTEDVRKATDKIFKVHHELFRKLSQ